MENEDKLEYTIEHPTSICNLHVAEFQGWDIEIREWTEFDGVDLSINHEIVTIKDREYTTLYGAKRGAIRLLKRLRINRAEYLY